MRISKEDYEAVTYNDIRDISIDENLTKLLLEKVRCDNLTDLQIAKLILVLMKSMAVSYHLGTKERLN